MQKEKRNVYKEVTDKIIQAIEAGTPPWQLPFKRLTDMNGMSGRPYRGINVLLLWMSSFTNGFVSPYWLTYREAKKLGGYVKKGERGTPIIFWKVLEVEQKDEDGEPLVDPETGEPEVIKVPFARFYTVFNFEQTVKVRLPKKFRAEMPEPDGLTASLFALPVIRWGKKCSYHPHGDYIQLPPRGSFENDDAFWASFFHELIHWTGPRVERDLHSRFEEEAYAMEELVAEIGASFLCAHAGVPADFEQNAAYVNSWLEVLNRDTKAIFTCARKAQEAVDWLLKQVAQEQEERIQEAA